MIVTFDYGGVLSARPEEFALLIRALLSIGCEVKMVTGVSGLVPSETEPRERFRERHGLHPMQIVYCKADNPEAHPPNDLPTKQEVCAMLLPAFHFDNDPIVIERVRKATGGRTLGVLVTA